MKRKFLSALALLLLSSAGAKAEEIAFESCPAPVRSTILASLRGGSLEGVEHYPARSRYVAEIRLERGRDLEIEVAPDGRLARSAEDVTFGEIPRPVRKSIRALLGSSAGSRLEDLEKEKVRKRTRYLAEIDRQDAPDWHVVLSKKGRILRR